MPTHLEPPGSTSVHRYRRTSRSSSMQSATKDQIRVLILNQMSGSDWTPVRQRVTPCETRTRNLRIRSPTPCPLGQGGCIILGECRDLIARRFSGCYAIIHGQASTLAGWISWQALDSRTSSVQLPEVRVVCSFVSVRLASHAVADAKAS